MHRSSRRSALLIASAEIWRVFKLNFRGFDALIEIMASVIFILGITLTIAIQNPSILSSPEGVRGICWGVIVFIMISDKLWIVGHSLERERRNRILENVLATRVLIWVHTVSPALAAMMWTLASLAIASLTVFPMLGVNPLPTDPLVFAAGYILSETMAAGISLIYGIIAMLMRRPWIATNVLQFVLPVISGMIPYSYAPQYLREIMILNPLSYPTEILRRGATGQQYMPIDTASLALYSLAGIAAIYALGMISIGYVVKRLRKRSL